MLLPQHSSQDGHQHLLRVGDVASRLPGLLTAPSDHSDEQQRHGNHQWAELGQPLRQSHGQSESAQRSTKQVSAQSHETNSASQKPQCTCVGGAEGGIHEENLVCRQDPEIESVQTFLCNLNVRTLSFFFIKIGQMRKCQGLEGKFVSDINTAVMDITGGGGGFGPNPPTPPWSQKK